MKIEEAVRGIAARWGSDMFVNGDCHTLAMALHHATALEGSGVARKGQLFACLRHSVEEDGAIYSTGYSHMVYVTPAGEHWDIHGPGADIRWEESIDTETVDKWGMRNELEWVEVPCQHPAYCDTHVWLQEHCGCIDTGLEHKLVRFILGIESGDKAPAELEFA